jgi:hypothetical protein
MLGADRGDRDRVRVVGFGLPAVAGVEHPCPGGELGGHVDHVFPVGQESLRQRPAGAVAALDRPRPIRPRRDMFAPAAEPTGDHARTVRYLRPDLYYGETDA